MGEEQRTRQVTNGNGDKLITTNPQRQSPFRRFAAHSMSSVPSVECRGKHGVGACTVLPCTSTTQTCALSHTWGQQCVVRDDVRSLAAS